MSDDFELGWAVGLFEGEGCISCTRQPNPKHPERLYWMRYVVVSSTDRDVLERFQRAVGMGVIRGPYTPKGEGREHHKQIWKWSANGYGEMKRTLALMYQHLSPRRQAQARVLLDHPPDPRGRRYSAAALAEFEAIEVPGW